MHGIGGGLALAEQIGRRIATAAITEGEAATTALAEGVVGVFAMRSRDHEAVFVIGKRQMSLHALGRCHGQPCLLEHGQVLSLIHI